jgi:hypothetical protein
MEAPKLRAFDLVPVAGGQDLVVTIEEIVAGPFVDNDNGIWTRPYTAVDSNGNKAVFNVTFKVTVVTAEMLVTLLEIDQPNSTKGNENCARNQVRSICPLRAHVVESTTPSSGWFGSNRGPFFIEICGLDYYSRHNHSDDC